MLAQRKLEFTSENCMALGTHQCTLMLFMKIVIEFQGSFELSALYFDQLPFLPGRFRKLEMKVVGILAISAKWTRVKENEVPKHVAKSSLN